MLLLKLFQWIVLVMGKIDEKFGSFKGNVGSLFEKCYLMEVTS